VAFRDTATEEGSGFDERTRRTSRRVDDMIRVPPMLLANVPRPRERW